MITGDGLSCCGKLEIMSIVSNNRDLDQKWISELAALHTDITCRNAKGYTPKLPVGFWLDPVYFTCTKFPKIALWLPVQLLVQAAGGATAC